ncbi:hypothetical protein [Candidatus Magnetomonas plexicatena]|uniref:hypothetical protein n=1 Tax=Candidatus Magnetomonas plexicatena TaxID=2552947 RepID=UPI001C765E78|nr:hypothetical protein E2O03_014310 [Nitrospirales bacterium LBB_01]
MKLENYTGSSNWGNLRIMWAVIDSIDSDNDTANITILDETKTKTTETYQNVIFYYNCQNDMTVRSNGALEGSSMAFEKNDQLYVGYDLSGDDKTNLKILGRLDGLKSCGESIILLIIDDSAQTSEGGSVSYILKQYTINTNFSLVGIDTPGAKVSKYHNGTALVIQGSEDKNNSVATVADKFGFSERWDNIDGMEKGWGSILVGENANYIIGSNNAWNPDEGMSATKKARRNYIANSAGNITSCYYSIKIDTLGTCLCYVGAYPTNRTLQRQWITYRASVTGADLTSSAFTDYETGNPEQDGYTWKYHRVIAVVSTSEALLLTKRKLQAKSGFISRLVTVETASTENLSIYGPCYAIGQCFIGGQFWYGIHTTHTIERYRSQQIGIRQEDVTYYETLEIGDITIENVSYNIKVEETFDDLIVYPFNTPIASDVETDLCHGSCKGWDGQCTDSFSGGVTSEDFEKFNEDFTVRTGATYCSGGRPGVQVDVLTIPAGATRTETGGNDLHILGFDNYQGSKYIILFYEKTDVTLTEEVNEVGYDTAYSYTANTKYYMYIKSDSSSTKTLLATKTATTNLVSMNPHTYASTNTGSYVSKVSCQINRGIAVYTYCIVNVEIGAQTKRVVGYQNLTNSKYGTGQSKEYDSNSDLNVSDTYWQYKIAVGVTKG